MDFQLTPEQQAVRELCRDFAREVVAPAAEELDREHRFGYDIIRRMGELGLFGLPFSEEYGGAGSDFLSLCLAIEEISRADTGVGIEPDHLPQVGTPFYTTKERGTGLGLAIAQRIVERHGGTVAIASEPGRGTTVRVALPGTVAAMAQAA